MELAIIESKSWIEILTNKNFKYPNDIRKSLQSGIILCDLINVLKPGTIRKYNKIPTPVAFLDNLSLVQNACIAEFGLNYCQVFDIRDLDDPSIRGICETEEEIEFEISKKLKNVLIAIFWLGKWAHANVHQLPALNFSSFHGLFNATLELEEVDNTVANDIEEDNDEIKSTSTIDRLVERNDYRHLDTHDDRVKRQLDYDYFLEKSIRRNDFWDFRNNFENVEMSVGYETGTLKSRSDSEEFHSMKYNLISEEGVPNNDFEALRIKNTFIDKGNIKAELSKQETIKNKKDKSIVSEKDLKLRNTKLLNLLDNENDEEFSLFRNSLTQNDENINNETVLKNSATNVPTISSHNDSIKNNALSHIDDEFKFETIKQKPQKLFNQYDDANDLPSSKLLNSFSLKVSGATGDIDDTRNDIVSSQIDNVNVKDNLVENIFGNVVYGNQNSSFMPRLEDDLLIRGGILYDKRKLPFGLRHDENLNVDKALVDDKLKPRTNDESSESPPIINWDTFPGSLSQITTDDSIVSQLLTDKLERSDESIGPLIIVDNNTTNFDHLSNQDKSSLRVDININNANYLGNSDKTDLFENEHLVNLDQLNKGDNITALSNDKHSSPNASEKSFKSDSHFKYIDEENRIFDEDICELNDFDKLDDIIGDFLVPRDKKINRDEIVPSKKDGNVNRFEKKYFYNYDGGHCIDDGINRDFFTKENYLKNSQNMTTLSIDNILPNNMIIETKESNNLNDERPQEIIFDRESILGFSIDMLKGNKYNSMGIIGKEFEKNCTEITSTSLDKDSENKMNNHVNRIGSKIENTDTVPFKFTQNFSHKSPLFAGNILNKDKTEFNLNSLNNIYHNRLINGDYLKSDNTRDKNSNNIKLQTFDEETKYTAPRLSSPLLLHSGSNRGKMCVDRKEIFHKKNNIKPAKIVVGDSVVNDFNPIGKVIETRDVGLKRIQAFDSMEKGITSRNIETMKSCMKNKENVSGECKLKYMVTDNVDITEDNEHIDNSGIKIINILDNKLIFESIGPSHKFKPIYSKDDNNIDMTNDQISDAEFNKRINLNIGCFTAGMDIDGRKSCNDNIKYSEMITSIARDKFLNTEVNKIDDFINIHSFDFRSEAARLYEWKKKYESKLQKQINKRQNEIRKSTEEKLHKAELVDLQRHGQIKEEKISEKGQLLSNINSISHDRIQPGESFDDSNSSTLTASGKNEKRKDVFSIGDDDVFNPNFDELIPSDCTNSQPNFKQSNSSRLKRFEQPYINVYINNSKPISVVKSDIHMTKIKHAIIEHPKEFNQSNESNVIKFINDQYNNHSNTDRISELNGHYVDDCHIDYMDDNNIDEFRVNYFAEDHIVPTIKFVGKEDDYNNKINCKNTINCDGVNIRNDMDSMMSNYDISEKGNKTYLFNTQYENSTLNKCKTKNIDHIKHSKKKKVPTATLR